MIQQEAIDHVINGNVNTIQRNLIWFTQVFASRTSVKETAEE
jgi:hypothetical protein